MAFKDLDTVETYRLLQEAIDEKEEQLKVDLQSMYSPFNTLASDVLNKVTHSLIGMEYFVQGSHDFSKTLGSALKRQIRKNPRVFLLTVVLSVFMFGLIISSRRGHAKGAK